MMHKVEIKIWNFHVLRKDLISLANVHFDKMKKGLEGINKISG